MSDGLAATWYDGRTSRPHAVVLRLVDAATLEVDAGVWWRHEAFATIGLTSRLAGTHRTLRFADGSLVQAPDSDELDAWFHDRHSVETWVDRLERRWRAALAAVVTVVLCGVLFFTVGLPRLADFAARRIPLSAEVALGEHIRAMFGAFGLHSSSVAEARREAIRQRYAAYAANVPGASAYRVDFLDAAAIGPNAFALPGGAIVLTDQLVEALDDDELLAVLAHETGHQHHRHVMRSVLQDSAVVLAGALMSGDVGSASAVVIAVPTFLMRSHYSRDFEREADEFAFRTLAAAGISPRRFADALAKITVDTETKYPEAEENTYLSTHPATQARMARAVEAAAAFEARKGD